MKDLTYIKQIHKSKVLNLFKDNIGLLTLQINPIKIPRDNRTI